jgi:hypothetical protein
VHGRVEAVRALLEAEGGEDALVERHLGVDRERLVQERRVDNGRLLDEAREHRSDGPEDLSYLRGLHEGLVVVEERRVRRVAPLEALHVLSPKLEVLLERREEHREVALRAGLDPDLVPECAGADHLGPELGRDPALLHPVPPHDADEARVVGVVVERLLEGP